MTQGETETKTETTATSIAEYRPTAAAIADLRARYESVVFQVATTKGMKEARAARAELRTLRTDLERKRVEIKGPALDLCRRIDAEAKRITGEIVALEDPIDQQITAEEERKAREKAEREAAESRRIGAIRARILEIRMAPSRLVGATSVAIRAALEEAEADSATGWAAELEPDAIEAREESLRAMRELLARTEQDEAARAEIERQRAEQAERERVERERIAAEEARIAAAKAEQEARDRAAREAIEAAEREARAKIEAEQRAAREAIEAQERESRARIEEQERAARELAEARRQAERAEHERIEAARMAEEARLRAEQERIDRRRRESMGAREMLAEFRARYGHMLEFIAVVDAIDELLGVERAPDQPA